VESTVSILTSAFTAIGTMTTAYFGIRAVSNTAQHVTTRPATAATPNSVRSTTGTAAEASTADTTSTTDDPAEGPEQQG
jgi:hypothetical protein